MSAAVAPSITQMSKAAMSPWRLIAAITVVTSSDGDDGKADQRPADAELAGSITPASRSMRPTSKDTTMTKNPTTRS